MTSLSRQLETLSTAASQHLSVDAGRASLLFNKKEAAEQDRETIYQIGCDGLAQLKRIDSSIDDVELFAQSSIDFQRLHLTKSDNEELNDKIVRFLAKITPYLHHYCCQQALEWLIYKYRIHSYNAEELIICFLPFHESNIYARLLSVLSFNFAGSKEWNFLGEYRKKQQHVPFPAIVKAATSGSSSIISRIVDHVQRTIEVVGEGVEQKSPLIFTFLAKMLLSVIAESREIKDDLLSKILPFVVNGIRSKETSLRLTSLMVVCQLALSAKLTSSALSALHNILLLKIRSTTQMESLSAIVVLCQQQQVDSFSKKSIKKLLRREDLTSLLVCIGQLSSLSDLSSFFRPLWSSVVELLCEEVAEDVEAGACLVLNSSMEWQLSSAQASLLISSLLLLQSSRNAIPSSIQISIHAFVARYSDEMEELRSEWEVRDKKALSSFISSCNLELLLVNQQQSAGEAMEAETEEAGETPSKPPLDRHAALSSWKKAAAEMGESVTKKEVFSGDPLKKALSWVSQSNWEKVNWALEEMSRRPKYFENKLEEDVEDFFIQMLRLAMQKTQEIDLSILEHDLTLPQSDLLEVSLSARFVEELLRRVEEGASSAKKSRRSAPGLSENSLLKKLFSNETEEEWKKRLIFILRVVSQLSFVEVSPTLLTTLFTLLQEMNGSGGEKDSDYSCERGLVRVLLHLLSHPPSALRSIKESDLRVQVVVDGLRETTSHSLTRDSLRLLTAAVRIAPKSVVSHVMSVFTFMGSGLLRRDNDLTISIIEDTLHSLFSAIITQEGQPTKVRQTVSSACRLLAAAVPDIPAHRRKGSARAIATAIGEELTSIAAILFIDTMCSKWQRAPGGKREEEGGVGGEACEEMAAEMVSALSATSQLSAILSILSFLVRLGVDSSDGEREGELSPWEREMVSGSTRSLPRLRHLRFSLLGLVLRCVSNRDLYESLASVSEESLAAALLPIGTQLLSVSASLHSLCAKSTEAAQAPENSYACRYWSAFASRAECVADKLRHLMPGRVSARIILSILADKKVNYHLLEKALQLANVKLLTEGGFCVEENENDQLLSSLAESLTNLLLPCNSAEKILLCQNAAFSLKLIAKKLRKGASAEVFSTTMKKCLDIVQKWESLDESLVGNVLLLAGELFRSQEVRVAFSNAQPLLSVCTAIIALSTERGEAADEKGKERTPKTRGQRIRQQSLCGRPLGEHTLLICAVTCSERLLSRVARFLSPCLPACLVETARLAGRFALHEAAPVSRPSKESKNGLEYRLHLIRKALTAIELRFLLPHIVTAAEKLSFDHKALTWLLGVTASAVKETKRDWLIQHHQHFLSSLVIPTLHFRALHRQPEMLETVSRVESSVFACLLVYADELSEVELRPVLTRLVEWAGEGLLPDASLATRLRLPTIFHFANQFYSSFNTLALVYFGRLFDMSIPVLRRCNAASSSSEWLFSLKKSGELSVTELDFLLTQCLRFVGNCCKHSTFLTSDRWSLLRGDLAAELLNSRVEGHEERCLLAADVIYNAAEIHPDTLVHCLQLLLEKTRDSKAKIRFRCLRMLEKLGSRIGDALAPHLPLLMPFLAELMEDDNRAVEEQCEKVLRLLQTMFGEDISEGFV